MFYCMFYFTCDRSLMLYFIIRSLQQKQKSMYERRMELVVSATGGLSESCPKYSMFVQTGRLTSGSKQQKTRKTYNRKYN